MLRNDLTFFRPEELKMKQWLIYGMVYGGAALMVWNIICFIRYMQFLQGQRSWRRNGWLLKVPVFLLLLFLTGYLLVGVIGKPDLIVAGVLFGGSVFVFIIYQLMNRITQQVMEWERMEAELESNRMKTRFLATMSHEMKTPMNVILGLDTLALKNPDLPTETREQLRKIDLSARHLLGLIRNMLEMNDLESGQVTLKNEEFSLKDALDQVNAIVATLCDAKGLHYEPVFPKTKDYLLYGDVTQLKESLLSILINAVKYTDSPGTVRFVLEVNPCTDGKRSCLFTISDTGIGMDPEFLPRVFDAFAQEESGSTTRYGGSGLSLAVTKRMVELMGGTIQVQSQKGVGTVFTMTIPMQCVRETSQSSPEEAEKVTLEGKRVLIVEDLPENAEIVADLLELEGVETEWAENGQVAVEMIEKSAEGYYDAILMDLRMPVMDGLEATKQIRGMDREDARNVPIIALTANSFETDVKASLSAGMNAHLAKPVDADMLYDTLKDHIRPTAQRNLAAEVELT